MAEKLHKALARLLLRTNLSELDLPSDPKKWEEFIERINRSYNESDQERYLLERSMEISSQEMHELNSKLKEAQQLASLGYWYHDTSTGENIWSKELYRMFKLDISQPAPNIEGIYSLVHPDDLKKLKNFIDKAFKDGEKYEIEIRMRYINGSDSYRWYHIIGSPKVEDNFIHRLSGVTMDITERKIAEESVILLQQQLVTSARRAGMADVATSVLHNVGNVLNSMNVSIHLINELMVESDFAKLLSAEKMLIDNEKNLAEFITKDEKGKLIPTYLYKITTKLQNNFNQISRELQGLLPHLDHLKTITEMQKNLSGISGVLEKIFVPEVIETALKMSGSSFEKSDISLIKEYNETPSITTDKAKLLQIVVNLIQNARESLKEVKIDNKQIIISINNIDNEKIKIQVSDNGIGINHDNLIKIFSFGFTTKKSGHGFGLHSSSLAAKEIGGKLEVTSPGLNQGATFSLTLPMTVPTRRVAT